MKNQDERYYSLVRVSRSMVLGIQNEIDLRTAINCLMNGIFKLPPIKSGLTTRAALELPKDKRTPEHFYGRTESATRLIKELIENPSRSDKALVAFLKSRARIHYATKKENMDLRSYMKKNPRDHWRKAYQACCSELVECKYNTNKKRLYVVDDTVYNTVKEAAIAHNLSIEGARNRFMKSKKFPNWLIKELR